MGLFNRRAIRKFLANS